MLSCLSKNVCASYGAHSEVENNRQKNSTLRRCLCELKVFGIYIL